jgi:predicted small lipoprotein YifL
MRAILPVVVTVLLTACGLKDDLYLPDSSEAGTNQASTQEPEKEPEKDGDNAEDT